MYRPDSTLTGRDTCRYVLCDTAHVCDTAVVVVYVDTNYVLLPVAGFKEDTINGGYYNLHFDCASAYDGGDWGLATYQLSSISLDADSLSWRIRTSERYGSWVFDSITYFSRDTISFTPVQLSHIPGLPQDVSNLEICLTAYNKYGSSTHCDTSCALRYEGITEVPLSNIHIYPNPADRILTIDMRQNNNSICADYAAIDIYDALGQKLRSIPRHDSSRLVEVDVTDMPEGIYVSTIRDTQGKEMVLGRFTVIK